MTKRILYIEDNQANMVLVKRIVEADGYQFFTAGDGPSGWEAVLNVQPDLILMDLMLPGDMSGLDLTRRLKEHPATAEIPIVALTAFGGNEAEEAALAAGCAAFLHKPADIRQVRAVFRHYLGPLLPSDQKSGVSQIYL